MKIEGRTGHIGQLNQHVVVLRMNGVDAPKASVWTHLIIDCSTSTTPFHEDLKEDAIKFVQALDERDHVSVEIFSGHGRAKIIATPTRCDVDGKQFLRGAIEDGVHLLDVTVFSEPLQLTLDTMTRFMARMPDVAHSVVLFTDGCAVPEQWNTAVEEQKSLEIANAIGKTGAIFSVIGYGVYYNYPFIRLLMGEAGFTGIQRHVSEIDGLDTVVRDIRNVAGKTTIADVDVTIKPNKGTAGRVLKTTPDLVIAGTNGRCRTKSLYEDQAALFVELDQAATSALVEGTVNGKRFEERIDLGNFNDADAADFVRALGAAAFLDGNRERAAELLDLLGSETGLQEKFAFAYTDREERESADWARRYFRDRKFIGAGLKATGPNHSVLNVIRTLIETPGIIVNIPKGAYKRGGLISRDPRVIDDPYRMKLVVTGYVSHQERANFSLLGLKEVGVRPENGNGAPKTMFVPRTINIIRGGNLVMPELRAMFTTDEAKAAFVQLQEANVIAADQEHDPHREYTLNLRDLKMISPNWAQPGNLGLVVLLREEKELEAEQKAINARLDTLGKRVREYDGNEEIYPENGKKVEGLPSEYYDEPCVDYRLMKYKPKTYDCFTMQFPQAAQRIKEVRRRLVVVRFLSRAITFACERTGSRLIPWGNPKTSRDKQEQIATYQGAQLKRVIWKEQFVCN